MLLFREKERERRRKREIEREGSVLGPGDVLLRGVPGVFLEVGRDRGDRVLERGGGQRVTTH